MFGWLAYIDEFGIVRYVINDEPVLDDDYTLVETRETGVKNGNF